MLLLLVGTADAQTLTVPKRLAVACGVVTPDATKNLTDDYLSSNWKRFHQHAVETLEAISDKCETSDHKKITIAPDREVVVLLWVGKPPLGGDPVVYRGLVQHPAGDPFNDILPGIDGDRPALELFLSTEPKNAIATVYTSVRARNPLEEQLPAFAEAVVNPLFALLASTRREIAARMAALPPSVVPTHFATISRIALPFARSAIHVDVKVALAPTENSINEDIANLQSKNAGVTGAHTPCARELNGKFRTIVSEQLIAPLPDTKTCIDDFDTCTGVLLEAFSKEYELISKCCETSDLALKELLAVDASYRDYLTSLTSGKVTGAFDLKNSPKRLASFGVVTAFALYGKVPHATRVELNDDGNLVADPLDRQLNLVVVNMGFKRYNADAFHPTLAERIQWFVGAVVTPDFGVAGGVSAHLVRGLSVNFGGALLGVRGLKTDDTLGAAPTHPEDAFNLAQARVIFVGVGYNFR
jgi:hypothetical protein